MESLFTALGCSSHFPLCGKLPDQRNSRGKGLIFPSWFVLAISAPVLPHPPFQTSLGCSSGNPLLPFQTLLLRKPVRLSSTLGAAQDHAYLRCGGRTWRVISLLPFKTHLGVALLCLLNLDFFIWSDLAYCIGGETSQWPGIQHLLVLDYRTSWWGESRQGALELTGQEHTATMSVLRSFAPLAGSRGPTRGTGGPTTRPSHLG